VLDDGPLYSLPDDTDDDGNDDPLPLGTLEPDDGYDEPALDGALEPDDGADDEADDGTDEPLDGALPLLGVADDWLGHDSLPDGVLDDGTDEPLYSLLDGVDGTLEPELGADEPLDGYDEPDDGTDEPLDGALPLLGVADDWLGHDSDDDDGDEALPLGTLEPPDDGPLYSLLENEPDDGTDEPLDGALEAELGTDDSPLGTLLLLGVADDWLGNDSLLDGVLDDDGHDPLNTDDGTDELLLLASLEDDVEEEEDEQSPAQHVKLEYSPTDPQHDVSCCSTPAPFTHIKMRVILPYPQETSHGVQPSVCHSHVPDPDEDTDDDVDGDE
jgi:hypothetical protein